MRSHFPEINRSGRTKGTAVARGLCATALLISCGCATEQVSRSLETAGRRPPGSVREAAAQSDSIKDPATRLTSTTSAGAIQTSDANPGAAASPAGPKPADPAKPEMSPDAISRPCETGARPHDDSASLVGLPDRPVNSVAAGGGGKPDHRHRSSQDHRSPGGAARRHGPALALAQRGNATTTCTRATCSGHREES